ncbi:MAG TPA: molybdopterin cofactor-binding domain-containing protein [Mycobacteriales bacterium]|nr:molybdopterin cofactor-binding domain-containing protein [Mycobacteriales bacterium]
MTQIDRQAQPANPPASPAEPTGPAGIPASLVANPGLSRWLRVDPDGTVAVRTGKVEIGQGILTALAQIAAEELDVDPARIRMVPADTADGPDEGLTAGSMSIQRSGAALRHACAQARALLLDTAARRLGVPADRFTVSDGAIALDGAVRTDYWTLAGDAEVGAGGLFDVEFDPAVPAKSPADYRVVGTALPRLDIPDKVSGRPRFVSDLTLPGLVYGRVVRPPSPAAWLSTVDADPVRSRPGVLAVVCQGSFLGVLAEREAVAVTAAAALREAARWETPATLPDQTGLTDFLTSAPSETAVTGERVDAAAAARAVRTVSATYHKPFLAHASIGPSCAVACWRDDGVLAVWTHSQGIFGLRAALARVLDLPAERIVLHHAEGPGSYGHNGADDAAFDAVLLARAVPGRPVMVQWSRQDEHAWEPYGPAATVRLSAGLDADDRVVSWRADVWSNGHSNRPSRGAAPGAVSRLLAAGLLTPGRRDPTPVAADVPMASGGGTGRNAIPCYDFADYRLVSHVLTVMPLRTSSLRALGATANVFAIESFMDELAAAAGVDPVEFRLAHLVDPRSAAVVQAAARLGGWGSPVGGDSRGRGFGFARYKNTGAYCAVVAEVEATHEVRVRRLTVVADVGLAVNPDGVANQFEGGAIQATSWAVREQVRFDRTRITSEDWETYPILRFSEVPAVDVEVIQRLDEPSLGAGEAAAGPTVAAIANAVAAALGVRIRDLPLTPENILATLDRTGT